MPDAEWPSTLPGYVLHAIQVVEYTIFAALAPTSYFLTVVLVGGRRRASLTRGSCFAGGFCSGSLVALFAFGLSVGAAAVLSCGIAACAAGVLLFLAPRSVPSERSRRRAVVSESYGDRRGSQPFAFGLAAGIGAIVIMLIREGLSARTTGDLSELGQLVTTVPYLTAAMGVLFGALFALGGALIGLIRRGATAATPYGAIAGAVFAFVAEASRPPDSVLIIPLAYCALVAGALGTMFGPRAASEAQQSAERRRRRA